MYWGKQNKTKRSIKPIASYNRCLLEEAGRWQLFYKRVVMPVDVVAVNDCDAKEEVEFYVLL